MTRGRQPTSTAKRIYDDVVCKKLNIAMIENDITMRELSRVTKIPYNTVYNILAGRYAVSLYNLAKICTVLHLDANKLLGIR